ncbi:MAG: tRNA (guanosine(46)-N7)-methyltransferase TrmB [Pseudomonadota bacterium]
MASEAQKPRSIKSFVRRTGRITPSQKNALDQHWKTFGIDYRDNPLEIPSEYSSVKLEIGIGNGDALISMAQNGSESFYIGIEVHEPGIGRCLNLIQKQGLENVRLLRHDAVEVLQQMIPSVSLDRVLLFFPDPWHKKRHHKRRIVNRQFCDLLHLKLKPGGVIHMATDWQEYAEWMSEVFLQDLRFENMGDENGYVPCPDYRPLTKFERRGRKLGHGVWDLCFARKSD